MASRSGSTRRLRSQGTANEGGEADNINESQAGEGSGNEDQQGLVSADEGDDAADQGYNTTRPRQRPAEGQLRQFVR